ncbi:MAG TPA: molybdopterin converting factor subunit 1 [Acidiphilium sp.]|nr:MAG: molybdopterin converting factor subunit 1 [Acidiphilium sp. 21-60-14]OYV89524.1 MAG: molybdopterin converting factor subunit 1 [Acidiphilium sp. 37-60-79]OZB39667.1 MAG: molybdopterin converting factor subunit 1 [Acidiphilium sp. 34-60-192]HQT87476.1 molybdopterin converting factor subunit 1 [Acidiphilium sp.]HQU24850.1 molybdopterin converting factor subunit 1 [Acidiphilium sp.]
MIVTIRYFAWLRERIGHAEERVDPPASITTIGALTDWLADLSPAHANAFAQRAVIKTAIDQQFVNADALIAGAHEIAFFPPFTGG